MVTLKGKNLGLWLKAAPKPIKINSSENFLKQQR